MLTQEIIEDIHKNRISHAVIIEGGDENERYETAKELAMAILCTGDESKPCGECKDCQKVKHDSHPDLHFLKKEEKANGIKVDEIRELKRQSALKPNDGMHSVFVILDAQDMNIQAQNALLKVFEEPNDYTSFILTAPSKSAFLETIISRGSIYSLSGDSAEKSTFSESAKEISQGLCKALCNRNEYEFLLQSGAINKDKQLMLEITECLGEMFSSALTMQNIQITDADETTALISRCLNTVKLISYIEHTKFIQKRIKANANFNLLTAEFVAGFFK